MTDAPTFANPDDMTYGVGAPFSLAGKRVKNGEPWSEEFHLLATIPQGAVTDMSRAVTIENGELRYGSVPVTRFIRASIIPDDEARFDALVRTRTGQSTSTSSGR